jgi:hypothetical protein
MSSRSALEGPACAEPGPTLHSRCQTHRRGRSALPGEWCSFPDRDPRRAHGGARRDRTDDLMLAKHALYQLSYGPLGAARGEPGHMRPKTKTDWPRLVGPGRFELPTSRLSGVRSNQLSYGPSLGAAHKGPAPSWSPRRSTPRGLAITSPGLNLRPAMRERETKTATSRLK